jgi:hypothetical protein
MREKARFVSFVVELLFDRSIWPFARISHFRIQHDFGAAQIAFPSSSITPTASSS